MSRVLITAFEPYDSWSANASWLSLIELTRELPDEPRITTRLYPVDFSVVRERLYADMAGNYDYSVHLGQAPGSTRVQLEAIGINVGGLSADMPDVYQLLATDGPVAYRSQLPLAIWAGRLRQAGIPARVSYHAGTFLCNATLYLAHYYAERCGWLTRSTFVHLPLETSQVLQSRQDLPSLSAATSAQALRLLLAEMASTPVA